MSVNSIAYNRHLTILDKLEAVGKVHVDDLAEELGVSSVTIRRDLDYLNEHGFLIRIHGGATRIQPRQTRQTESRFDDKGGVNVAEKERIATRATQLISENDIVFLNSGSTALFFLRALVGKRVRVITNNAASIQSEIDPLIELLVLGGEYREQSRSFVGEFALNTLRNIYSNHTILGTNGVSIEQGLTTTVYQECNINQAMIENTHGKVVVLADHSKIEHVSNFVSAPIDAVDILIADTSCPADFVSEAQRRGIEVITV
jgi:DeoR family fructose operon transcriptional repressor